MPRVVFLGNHEVVYSTESHHCWTFEHLGWEVTRLQENRSSANQVVEACKGVQLFSWTHTHEWQLRGPMSESEMVVRIKEMGVPSYSYHLDRYWQIGSREGSYLKHPSFSLDYFFSTDGGNDARWKEAGINHVWLLGGVVEYGAFCATPNNTGPFPIVFTGSENYHAEYPWRAQMIHELRHNYGDRFKVVNGVREKALNELYANCTVVVGDHIFAGCPRYSSDRLFEVTGRGGFLLYPDTPDVTNQIPGLQTYAPQNIDDLIKKIDYFLDKSNEVKRLLSRDAAFNYVRQNCTYTHRLRQILKIMNLE